MCVKITPTTTWEEISILPIYQPDFVPKTGGPMFAAAYLPFKKGGKKIDWRAFRKVLKRIYDAGLIPVINADTGFAFGLSDEDKVTVLQYVRKHFGYVDVCVGVTAKAEDGSVESLVAAYQKQIDAVEVDDKVMVMVMISPQVTALKDDELISFYEQLKLRRGILHILTEEFVPFGRIYSPYETAGILALCQYVAVKISDLFGPSVPRLLALKKLAGFDADILSGVDSMVEEAFDIADGILMGAAVLCPALFTLLRKLRAEAREDITKRWRYEHLVREVQSMVTHQFTPSVKAHCKGRYDVGCYRSMTAYYLWLMGVIESPNQPEFAQDEHVWGEEVIDVVASNILRVRKALEGIGEDPDIVEDFEVVKLLTPVIE